MDVLESDTTLDHHPNYHHSISNDNAAMVYAVMDAVISTALSSSCTPPLNDNDTNNNSNNTSHTWSRVLAWLGDLVRGSSAGVRTVYCLLVYYVFDV